MTTGRINQIAIFAIASGVGGNGAASSLAFDENKPSFFYRRGIYRGSRAFAACVLVARADVQDRRGVLP